MRGVVSFGKRKLICIRKSPGSKLLRSAFDFAEHILEINGPGRYFMSA